MKDKFRNGLLDIENDIRLKLRNKNSILPWGSDEFREFYGKDLTKRLVMFYMINKDDISRDEWDDWSPSALERYKQIWENYDAMRAAEDHCKKNREVRTITNPNG